jgi:CBS domain-containing protein
MPTVEEILARKGALVYTIEGSVSVLEATRRMNRAQIGALVVTAGGKVVGIFSERDVLRKVVAEDRRPEEVSVAEIMSDEVVCIEPTADIDEASGVMKEKRIRHLPVCDRAGRLLGMLSIGDINAHHATHQQQQIHFLNEYIYGRA